MSGVNDSVLKSSTMSASSCLFGNAIVRVKKSGSGSASPARWRWHNRGSCRGFEGHQSASAAGSPASRGFPGSGIALVSVNETQGTNLSRSFGAAGDL